VARPTRPSSKAVFAASSNLAPFCPCSFPTMARQMVSSSSSDKRIYVKKSCQEYLQASPVGVNAISGYLEVFTDLDGKKVFPTIH
jgi:hypothetical protein